MKSWWQRQLCQLHTLLLISIDVCTHYFFISILSPSDKKWIRLFSTAENVTASDALPLDWYLFFSFIFFRPLLKLIVLWNIRVPIVVNTGKFSLCRFLIFFGFFELTNDTGCCSLLLTSDMLVSGRVITNQPDMISQKVYYQHHQNAYNHKGNNCEHSDVISGQKPYLKFIYFLHFRSKIGKCVGTKSYLR